MWPPRARSRSSIARGNAHSGWTAEDLAAEDTESLIEALYPDPRERERVHSFIREGKAEWTDFSTRTRHGRTIETTWTNVHLEDGRWVGIGQDITERKRAEQVLRESEERFRAIYEHGRMGIAVGDLEGRLLFANPVFEKILGYEQRSGDAAGSRSGPTSRCPKISFRIATAARAFGQPE